MPRRTTPGVRQLESGRYQARPTLDGVQVSLGTFDTAREARQAIEDARVSSRKGEFVDPGAGRLTLAGFATSWLDGRLSISDGTRRSYGVAIRSLDWLGDMELGDITPAHVRQRVAQWADGLAPATARLRLVHLKTILGAAVAEQRLVRNPARHPSVETPRGGNVKARRYLTFAEVEAVTAELDVLYSDLTWTMAWTGFRFHEAVGLTADQVDLDAGRFRLNRQWDPRLLRHAPLKGRDDETEVRPTPIAPDLVAVVQRRLGVGLLFPSPQRPGCPPGLHTYSDQLERACRSSGVERFTAHDLRHTCASWLHAVGVSIEEAAVWLGHRSSSITAQTYTHLWPRQLDVAAEKLAGIRDVDLGGGVVQLRKVE